MSRMTKTAQALLNLAAETRTKTGSVVMKFNHGRIEGTRERKALKHLENNKYIEVTHVWKNNEVRNGRTTVYITFVFRLLEKTS